MGYEEAISASDSAANMLKTEQMIQPQIADTGPPFMNAIGSEPAVQQRSHSASCCNYLLAVSDRRVDARMKNCDCDKTSLQEFSMCGNSSSLLRGSG